MSDKILVKFKEAVIKDVPLDKDIITIGRNQGNDIMLDNLAVSGFHAKISQEAGQFFVEDLNSTNGTFVNEKRVSKSALRPNDNIIIGKYILTYIGDSAKDLSDSTQKVKKQHSAQETMMLDTRQHKAMLEKSSGDAPAVKKVEKIGGFSVISGSTDKKEYDIPEKLATIGKDDNAVIKLKGFFAPSVGAIVNRIKDDYFISPPGSGKKPTINGESVDTRRQLKDGDIIEVGGLTLQFYLKEKGN